MPCGRPNSTPIPMPKPCSVPFLRAVNGVGKDPHSPRNLCWSPPTAPPASFSFCRCASTDTRPTGPCVPHWKSWETLTKTEVKQPQPQTKPQTLVSEDKMKEMPDQIGKEMWNNAMQCRQWEMETRPQNKLQKMTWNNQTTLSLQASASDGDQFHSPIQYK